MVLISKKYSAIEGTRDRRKMISIIFLMIPWDFGFIIALRASSEEA